MPKLPARPFSPDEADKKKKGQRNAKDNQVQGEGQSQSPKSWVTDAYSSCVFWGSQAAPYLVKQGLAPDALLDPTWVKSLDLADKVAAAVCEWAVEKNASSYCHWFQPMCGFKRHGQSACVQLAMFDFDSDRKAFMKLTGKDLLCGETDGSSFPSGNLRKTHQAGAYLTIDPLSPMFLSDDCIFVPACFVSYTGMALDEKTPLHRAEQALSREGKRLFKLLGHEIDGLHTNIGLEQELFFVPSEPYYKRPDLMKCGRTILGSRPSVTQKGSTHYMAPINKTKKVYSCMKEIQYECYKLGIPLKTRHREVAPNQYEFAPLYGRVIEQVDNNLMVMQLCEEIAPKHGLRALLAEKPFAGINGSGKHNNWSIATLGGTQLLNPNNCTKGFDGDFKIFPITMCAIISAVHEFGDLMRMSIACPGNDYRLGGMEAPPAIMTCHLGEHLTTYLEEFLAGDVKPYVPAGNSIDLGVDYLPSVPIPSEDRNRTSPFPYGGHRFEFRACGSSQNVATVNTVLSSMVAYEFKVMADRVEKGEDIIKVTQEMLKEHMTIVYNGDGYAETWPAKARERGLFVINSGVEAMKCFTSPKNIKLFEAMQVFTAQECMSRKYIMLEDYILTVQEEVLTLVGMIRRNVIPAVRQYAAPSMKEDLAYLDGTINKLLVAMEDIIKREQDAEKEVNTSEEKHSMPFMRHYSRSTEDNPGVRSQPAFEVCADLDSAAEKAREVRLELVRDVRAKIDELEETIPKAMWGLPSYEDLFFIDQTAPSTFEEA